MNECSKRDDEGKTSPANSAQADTAAANALTLNPPIQTKMGKDYVFQGAGVLRITFPQVWVDSPKRIMEGTEPVNVIEFMPFTGTGFEILVEVRNLGEAVTKGFDIRASLMKAGNVELPNCVEQSLDIHDLKGPEVIGSYYTVTDKRWVGTQPQPGEYKYLT